MICTLRLLAVMLISASPVTLIPSRLASTAVQRFNGSVTSVATAMAALALVTDSPAALASPGFSPRKADPPSTPSVRRVTSEVDPSARVTLAAARRRAKEPVTSKKSLTETVSDPEASRSAPAAPSRLMA